jgi:3-keto-5-aminohexanoate cleavage enzyme
MAAVDFDRPVAIAVAPNGGRRTKADNPALPIGPTDLADVSRECFNAGASLIHLHVRDVEGRHLLDADAYREAISAIRHAIGDKLVIQITSEALGRYSPADQMSVIRAVRPEAVSLALRELMPDRLGEKAFADLLLWMKAECVVPQIILYSPEEAVRLSDLRKRGLIPWTDIPVLYVLGRYTVEQTSKPTDLLSFIAPDMPIFLDWSVCAFGRHEAACVTAGALLGGNIRVGFENNLLMPDGRPAESNGSLVSAARNAIESVGLKHASADDLRKAWTLV